LAASWRLAANGYTLQVIRLSLKVYRLPHFCNFYAQNYDIQHIVGKFMAHGKILRYFSLRFFLHFLLYIAIYNLLNIDRVISKAEVRKGREAGTIHRWFTGALLLG